ncbi:MAG: hypothetical protein L0229_12565, partial [Blastocatellia bacterium]|nr:hypothetical protein [Blastocatellia bacterium]
LRLYEAKSLPVRVAVSHSVGTLGPIEKVQENIRRIAKHPLRQENTMLRIIGVKTFFLKRHRSFSSSSSFTRRLQQ